jgi:hypothetical protein
MILGTFWAWLCGQYDGHQGINATGAVLDCDGATVTLPRWLPHDRGLRRRLEQEPEYLKTIAQSIENHSDQQRPS